MLPMLVVSTVRSLKRHTDDTEGSLSTQSRQKVLKFYLVTLSDGLASFGGVAASLNRANNGMVWASVILAAVSAVLSMLTKRIRKPVWIAAQATLLGILFGMFVALAASRNVWWTFFCILPPLVELAYHKSEFLALGKVKSAAAAIMQKPSLQLRPQPVMTRRQRLNSYL